ncbi:MAG TPA: universal stress protein [Ktedonobacterales bacterium]
MFTRIIVPLDGTRFAEAALAPACELSRVFSAKLIITRAVPPYGFPSVIEGALPAGGLADIDSYDKKQQVIEATDTADAYLHAIAEKLRATGYPAEMLVELAIPGAAISQAAAHEHADLIVMSSHLRWKVPVQLTTSATLDVLVRSRVPLLAWRVADDLTDSEISEDMPPVVARPETPIIVPLDGSALAESALPSAQKLARGFGSSIVLVRAVESEADVAAGLAYLQRIRAEVMQEGVYAQCDCRTGSPLSVIETAWREYDGSLVVMASRGRLGPHGTFFGSTTAHMLEMAEAPILVVRPPDPIAVETSGATVAYVEH